MAERTGTDIEWSKQVSIKRSYTVILMIQVDASYNLFKVRVFLNSYMKLFDMGSVKSV